MAHKLTTRIGCVCLLAFLSASCAKKEDQSFTVKAYELWACASTAVSDPNELAALKEFKEQVAQRNFVRHEDNLIAANHEQTPPASGLREYSGPFYYYVHQRPVDTHEAKRGITWIATVYLHADKVRTRANGREWSEWQRVRTRNFVKTTTTIDGLGRWKCLVGAEIAWAEVSLIKGQWDVQPIALGVYEGDELQRATPLATAAQINGTESVQALVFPN